MKGIKEYQKLMGQHIVFIVDECQRALRAENRKETKAFFPIFNLVWFYQAPSFIESLSLNK
jgi:type I restriction enzyme R subunit